jgi:hypothetical protein
MARSSIQWQVAVGSGWVAAEPELLRRGTRACRSGGACVSESGEVAVRMIGRISRRWEQFGGAKLRR